MPHKLRYEKVWNCSHGCDFTTEDVTEAIDHEEKEHGGLGPMLSAAEAQIMQLTKEQEQASKE